MEIGEPLFFTGWNKPSLSDALRGQISSALPKAVDQLAAAEFGGRSDTELVELVLTNVRVEPLKLDLEAATADAKEIQIEAQNVWGERGRVPGLRVTKTVPFSGDRELWKLYPDEFDMNPPRGEIRSNTLVVGMEVREHESDQAVTHIQNTLTKIQSDIDRQTRLIEAYNRELPSHILPLIQARRSRLSKAADVLDKLR